MNNSVTIHGCTFARSQLSAMKREELRQLSSMHAQAIASPIDRVWLWSARNAHHIAFLLGDKLANGFPRKWAPDAPEALVPQRRESYDYVEAKLDQLEAKIDALTQVLIAWVVPRK